VRDTKVDADAIRLQKGLKQSVWVSNAGALVWGSQFWLQPAFSRHPAGRKTRRDPKEPPKKAAAGKNARPTIYAGAGWQKEYVALGNFARSRLLRNSPGSC